MKCPKCSTMLLDAPGVGLYCPTKGCVDCGYLSIPHAQDLRDELELNITKKDSDQIYRILQKLYAATEPTVYYYEYLRKNVKRLLEDKGYTVTTNNDRNEVLVTIGF
jgi:hypothetical protein